MAVRVGEHLHLDVARALDVALEHHRRRRRTPSAPRAARTRAPRASSPAARTTRMPLPPPPRDGLSISGKPMRAASAASRRVAAGRRRRSPARTGTPAAAIAAARPACRPCARCTSPGGPTNASPPPRRRRRSRRSGSGSRSRGGSRRPRSCARPRSAPAIDRYDSRASAGPIATASSASRTCSAPAVGLGVDGDASGCRARGRCAGRAPRSRRGWRRGPSGKAARSYFITGVESRAKTALTPRPAAPPSQRSASTVTSSYCGASPANSSTRSTRPRTREAAGNAAARGEVRLEPLGLELLLPRAARLDDAVRVEHQRVAGVEPHPPASGRRSPRARRARGRRAPPSGVQPAAREPVGRVVAGVDVLELARREVEPGREHGHEHRALVVARELAVHAADGLGDRRGARRERAEQRLRHRHEQRRADALAGDVADQQPDIGRRPRRRRRGRRPRSAPGAARRRRRPPAATGRRAAASPSGCRARARAPCRAAGGARSPR